ncbi:MAG TPA: hypothetical protein VKM94_02560 [Blastocatellia bacterium]|nr:hypothetical protein [Blastocatellia bacterium]
MNLVAVMMLIAIGLLEPSFADHNDATESKFLTIGEVSKIDVKSKSITINYATSYNIEQIANLGNDTGARGGGRSGGGTARGGGRGGRRGGGGGSAAPSASRGASAPLPKNYKVMISSKTVIKEGENEIKIDDLKVGDTVQVFSMKGGTKLDALEIVRTPKGNP